MKPRLQGRKVFRPCTFESHGDDYGAYDAILTILNMILTLP